MEFKVVGEIRQCHWLGDQFYKFLEEKTIKASNYVHKTSQDLYETKVNTKTERRKVRKFYTLWLVEHERDVEVREYESRCYTADTLEVGGKTYITKIYEDRT